MQDINLPQAKVIEEKENYGKIVIEPLFPGYGYTVGNAIRRVLISSLPGAAITSVKIEDVAHEFSTIPGVKEDVIEIMMNLKKIRLKLFGDEAVTLKLQATGPKEIKAKDIKTPSQVEIKNKDLYIATLDKAKAKLNMEMVVERGRGYEAAENRAGKSSIGTIQIDSIFSPVTWVNCTVENMRVGQRTDYHRVILEIKTDGTITPVEAFKSAVAILMEQFSVLKDIEGEKKTPEKKLPSTAKKDEKKVTKKKRSAKSVA